MIDELAILACGMLVGWFASELRDAPLGWEDDSGFHLARARDEAVRTYFRELEDRHDDLDDPDVIPLYAERNHHHHSIGA